MIQNTIKKERNSEAGMATSEYAVGTVGACGVGGILYKIATSDWFQSGLQDVFARGLALLPF